jgi:predicted PurR-regulated permease PerM
MSLLPILSLILEGLTPTLGAVALIVAVVLAIIFFFVTAMGTQRRELLKELSNINERLIKLELKNEYEKELKDIRGDINELNRRLSDSQKGSN